MFFSHKKNYGHETSGVFYLVHPVDLRFQIVPNPGDTSGEDRDCYSV